MSKRVFHGNFAHITEHRFGFHNFLNFSTNRLPSTKKYSTVTKLSLATSNNVQNTNVQVFCFPKE